MEFGVLRIVRVALVGWLELVERQDFVDDLLVRHFFRPVDRLGVLVMVVDVLVLRVFFWGFLVWWFVN